MDINAKINSLIDEYNTITRRIMEVNKEHETLVNRSLEIRGAIKALNELKKEQPANDCDCSGDTESCDS